VPKKDDEEAIVSPKKMKIERVRSSDDEKEDGEEDDTD
jgi:hypothetical protein